MTPLKFEALFDAIASPYMVLDAGFRYVAANRAYLAVAGRSMDELRGVHVFDAFPDPTPSGARLRESFERVRDTGQPDTLAFLPYHISPPVDGSAPVLRYWTCVHTPILDEKGRTAFILQNTAEVTDLVALQEATPFPLPHFPGESALLERTREVEAQHRRTKTQNEDFRRLFQQSPGMVAVLSGPEHICVFTNDQALRVIGRDHVVGLKIRDALPELIGQGFLEMLDEVFRTGKTLGGESRRVTFRPHEDEPEQELYLDFTYSPIFDAARNVTGIFVQGTDRTADVVTRRQQRIMIDELNHRVKNTLASVQSIVAHTLHRDADDMDAARVLLDDRIRALSRAHDLLTVSNWTGAEMREILETQTYPFGAARFSFLGPRTRLWPRAAISLAMVVHELASNAARHGALSAPGGAVDVAWRVDDPPEAGPRLLKLSWAEHGGPVVRTPTRRGFGSRLIDMTVRGELNGAAALDFEPAGVLCRLSIPYAPNEHSPAHV